MNHQKHTNLIAQIEEIKKNLKICQDMKDLAETDCEKLEFDLDKAEIQLMNLDLEDEETDEEYLQRQQQDYDTRIDLENSQR